MVCCRGDSLYKSIYGAGSCGRPLTADSLLETKNRRHVLCLREWQKAARFGRLWPSAEHTETGTVLQTAPRSVNNVKFYNYKIKLHFPIEGRNEKGEERWLKTYHTYLCPIYKQAVPREKVLCWTRSRAIQMSNDKYSQIQYLKFVFEGREYSVVQMSSLNGLAVQVFGRFGHSMFFSF